MSLPGIEFLWFAMLVMIGLFLLMLFWGIQFVLLKWLKRGVLAWVPLGANSVAAIGFAIARFGFEKELSVLRLELPLFGGMSMPWANACFYGLVLTGSAAAGCLIGVLLTKAMQRK